MNVPIPVIVGFFTVMAGVFLSLWKIWYDVQGIRKDLESRLDERIKEISNERDYKITRVYERFDAHKKYTDETFVRVTVCGLSHQNSWQQYSDLKKSVDELRGMIFALVQKRGDE